MQWPISTMSREAPQGLVKRLADHVVVRFDRHVGRVVELSDLESAESFPISHQVGSYVDPGLKTTGQAACIIEMMRRSAS